MCDLQIERVRQEFSRAKNYASEYEQGNTPIAHFFNARMECVSELLTGLEAGKILDVGCGPGKIGKIFRGRSVKYYGIDISEDMIEVCVDTFASDSDGQFKFFIGRMEDIPFRDACFDAVLCLGAFEYVLEPQLVMIEILRVLKPGGILLISMLNGSSPYRFWQSHVHGKFSNAIKRVTRLFVKKKNNNTRPNIPRPKTILFNEKFFRQLLTIEGLTVKDCVYYDFRLLLPPLDTMFPKSSVFLSRKLKFLERSKFKFLGTGFIIKCRKDSLTNQWHI